MRKNAWLTGGLALALGCVSATALAADHLDSPVATADPAADITDLYAWIDGGKVVLVMDVFPLADETSKFSDKVQYVFHVGSSAAFPLAGTNTDVICTFDTEQLVSCWAGGDYVTGNAAGAAGVTSKSGKMEVFAGIRADPFYFNLDGFNDTVTTVEGAAGGLTFDAAGCPALDAATSALLVGKLAGDPANPGQPGKDFFAGLNVLSLVVVLDASLVNGGGNVLNVWASTNQGGN